MFKKRAKSRQNIKHMKKAAKFRFTSNIRAGIEIEKDKNDPFMIN